MHREWTADDIASLMTSCDMPEMDEWTPVAPVPQRQSPGYDEQSDRGTA
jgi:hypothetical protein